MKIALRVDVDTFRGTRDGVPELCRVMAACGVRASFFFSVGPDNMGRHLWRLLKPAFLAKMLRSHAGRLYGWDILLRGTLWPGPVIGMRLKEIIRATASAGHEIGLHAWDHHAWQARLEKWDAFSIGREIGRAYDMLAEITGAPPTCSAAPGWKCSGKALVEKLKWPFVYNSDCRGSSIFLPVVGDKKLSQPQVPVTLPTYDEAVGRNNITMDLFGGHILSLLREDGLNVFTIHAEVEGIAAKKMFAEFVHKALALGHEFCPLGELVRRSLPIPPGAIAEGTMPGREGWVCVQKTI